jgi:Icc-related predicted phosphoesterase
MKIQILSDLHVEFKDYEYQKCDSDVVVLAGDIHTKDRGIEWAIKNIEGKPVVYVLGNHEFFGKSHPKFIAEARSKASGTNVHLLENEYINIEGVNFIGCTLWTDFEIFGDPRIAGYQCQQVMTDYKKIRKSPQYSKLRSIDTALIHAQSLNWLGKTLESLKGEPNVVVSHHGPSINSSPIGKREDITSAAYVSDLEGFISDHQPKFWFHGHLHNSSEYKIGDCTVVCNPKGYPGDENCHFDPVKCVEICL